MSKMKKKRRKNIPYKLNFNLINNQIFRICNTTFSKFSDCYIDRLCTVLNDDFEQFLKNNSYTDSNELSDGLSAITSYWRGTITFESYIDMVDKIDSLGCSLDKIRLLIEQEFPNESVDEKITYLLNVACAKHLDGLLYAILNAVSDDLRKDLQDCVDMCFLLCYKNVKASNLSENFISNSVLNTVSHLARSLKSSCSVLVLSFLSNVFEVIEQQYYELECFYQNYNPSELKEDVISSLCESLLFDSDEYKQFKQPLKYIDDYRELNAFAQSNGYVYNRSNGDHAIFRNDKGHVIVIPQGRVIGKGLSMRIQKDILIR